MSDDTKQTTIAEGTEFEGSICSDTPVNLSGVLRGTLEAPALTVTSSGRLQGKIKVEQLCSQGEVSGEIEAETAEIAGKVNDRTVIRAKRLEVRLAEENGGMEVSFGNCDLEVGQRPASGTDTSSDREQRQADENTVPVRNERR